MMWERASPRWLLASLVLNVFLLGSIAGGAWRWWSSAQAATAAAPAQQRNLRFAADELPADQRSRYQDGLRQARRESAASIKASREGRKRLLALVAASPFDRAAATAALAQIREADMATRARTEASVVDFAESLTPAERQILAASLERRSPFSPQAPSPAASAATDSRPSPR